jgi:hypothetical protein
MRASLITGVMLSLMVGGSAFAGQDSTLIYQRQETFSGHRSLSVMPSGSRDVGSIFTNGAGGGSLSGERYNTMGVDSLSGGESLMGNAYSPFGVKRPVDVYGVNGGSSSQLGGGALKGFSAGSGQDDARKKLLASSFHTKRVSEPASLWLLMGGIVGIAAYHKRQRAKITQESPRCPVL